MKKIIFVLTLVFSISAFSWQTKKQIDEFGDYTGEVVIYQTDTKEKSGFSVMKGNEFSIFSLEFIGGKGSDASSVVKFKVDNNNPITINAHVSTNGKFVYIGTSPELMELMKKGKILKVSVQKYDSTTVLFKYKLNGFSEALKQVK